MKQEITKVHLEEMRKIAFDVTENIKIALGLDEHYIDILETKYGEEEEIIKLLLWDLRNKDFEPTKDIERAEKFLKRDEE